MVKTFADEVNFDLMDFVLSVHNRLTETAYAEVRSGVRGVGDAVDDSICEGLFDTVSRDLGL